MSVSVSLCDDQSETPRRSGAAMISTCFTYPEELPTLCPSLAVWEYFDLYLLPVVPLQLYLLKFYNLLWLSSYLLFKSSFVSWCFVYVNSGLRLFKF